VRTGKKGRRDASVPSSLGAPMRGLERSVGAKTGKTHSPGELLVLSVVDVHQGWGTAPADSCKEMCDCTFLGSALSPALRVWRRAASLVYGRTRGCADRMALRLHTDPSLLGAAAVEASRGQMSGPLET